MSIKDNFYIREIDNTTANNVVKKCHYAHRKCSAIRSFGLFTKFPNKLVGVVIYGNTASPSVNKGICGEDEVNNVYELNRLYVDDGLPRNLESFLVGNTLKMLDKEIIISYADATFNHIGIIYQATNFIYTGLVGGNSFYYEEIDENGNRLHNRYLISKYGNTDNIRKAMSEGKNIYTVERAKKHRYIYFNADRRRKKELLSKLKFPIFEYPKQQCCVPITSDINISDNNRRLF